jgi:hypothetical protein
VTGPDRVKNEPRRKAMKTRFTYVKNRILIAGGGRNTIVDGEM